MTPKIEESKSSIRLPEIPLPIFSGSYEDWGNFKIQFESLISKNSNLSDSQKLFYLRAALKGDAKNIQSTDDTYESLFTALTQRFENKRLLIDSHILSILNHGQLQDSSKGLRAFIDLIKRNLRALSVLKHERNKLSDALLINIILQKLDKESRRQFELTLSSTQSPEFDDLISFLEKLSSILESIDRAPNDKPKRSANIPKLKTLMINNQTKRGCVLCEMHSKTSNSFHALNNCPVFLKMDVQQRIDYVKQSNMCINCLKGNHKVVICYSRFSCRVCSKKHHSLLHVNKRSEEAVPMCPSVSAANLTAPAAHLSPSPVRQELSDPGNFSLAATSLHDQGIPILCTIVVYLDDWLVGWLVVF